MDKVDIDKIAEHI